jgi:hypothetical protein
LLESLLVPAAEIAPGFATVSLVLEGGETLSATLLEEGATELTLDVAGELRVVARDEIVSTSTQASAMPPMGLALPLSELRDLIEYLSDL